MNSKHAAVFNIKWTPPKPSEDWSAKQKAEWVSNRKFYSCNTEPGELNVVSYTTNGEKVDRPDDELLREQAAQRLNIDLSNRIPDKSEARRIDEYMTRFNSLGAFNLGGAMTEQELKEWVNGAQKAPGIIWHAVASFPAKQSQYLGYEDMEKLVRQTFGGFLENAGFNPDNIALLAAMHENTKNKHIHFTFYEKATKYLDTHGELKYREKGLIDNNVLNEYRMTMTAYLDEHKKDLYNYRNAAVRGIRALNVVPSDSELYVALCTLSDKLPPKGRLQYNSENVAPYRKDIDSVVQMLLRRSPDALSAHKRTLSEIARRGKALSETGTKSNYVARLTAEYKSRLGNVVLGMVKKFRQNPKMSLRGDPKTRKQYKAAARRRRECGARVIHEAMRMLSGDGKSVQADFTRELARTEREIEYMQSAGANNRS